MNAEALAKHEKECAARYEVFSTEIATLKTDAKWTQKLIWGVFISILGFELNALFKLVGH